MILRLEGSEAAGREKKGFKAAKEVSRHVPTSIANNTWDVEAADYVRSPGV